jgi:DNA-binding CsgD family transcriptional regulator
MRLGIRRGEPDAARMDEVDAVARGTGESEGRVAVAAARAEQAWLAGDAAGAAQALAIDEPPGVGPFGRGELRAWRHRCGIVAGAAGTGGAVAVGSPVAATYQCELDGDPAGAAAAWTALGAPYEALLAWLQVGGAAAGDALARAATLAESLGARPAARRVRERAAALGLTEALPRPRRGPYSAAKEHPLGLTRREAEILLALADGLSNPAIAQRLSRSPRTVAHHVSALLAKLGVASRAEAAALARRHGLWPRGDGTG